MRARVLKAVAAGGIAGALALLSGCRPSDDLPGRLEVPREEEESAVCAPARDADAVLFGLVVNNRGGKTVALTEIRALNTHNVREVAIAVDLEGPAMGEFVTAARTPASNPAMQANVDALLARLVEPADAVLQRGDTVDVIVTITPADPAADAVVEAFEMKYNEAGRVHTVTAFQQVTLTSAESCGP